MPNPTIEQIKLPGSNQLYDIVDAGGRDLIAALSGSTKYLGVTTTPLTDGATTNHITVGGQSVTVTTGNIVIYGDAEFIWDGSKWDEFGDLSNLGHLAQLDNVVISKGAGDMVLGEDTTFTASKPNISITGGTTDTVLGSDATFTTTVTPDVRAVYADTDEDVVVSGGTDTFVKSYPGTTSKMATTTVPNVTGNTDVSIPNVTSVGSASTWSFTMDGTTLVIAGDNSSTPVLGTALSASKVTLGTAKTVATGSLDANGGGASVMTGLGTATTGSAISSLSKHKVEIAITVDDPDSFPMRQYVELATGITSATTTTNNKDQVTAVTGVGTAALASAPSITVGTNDKVKVAKYDDIVGGQGAAITGTSATIRTITFDLSSPFDMTNPATNIINGSSYYNKLTLQSSQPASVLIDTAYIQMGGTTVSGATTISSDNRSVEFYIPNVNGNLLIYIMTEL